LRLDYQRLINTIRGGFGAYNGLTFESKDALIGNYKEIIAALDDRIRELKVKEGEQIRDVPTALGGTRPAPTLPGAALVTGLGPSTLEQARIDAQFDRDRKALDARVIAADRQAEQARKALEAAKKAALQADRSKELEIDAQFAEQRRALDAKAVAEDRALTQQRQALEKQKAAALKENTDASLRAAEAFEQQIQAVQVRILETDRQQAVRLEALEDEKTAIQKQASAAQLQAAEALEQQIQALDARVLEQKRTFNDELEKLERKKQDLLAGKLTQPGGGIGIRPTLPTTPGVQFAPTLRPPGPSEAVLRPEELVARDLRPLTPSDLPGVALIPRPRPLVPSAPPRPLALPPGASLGQSAFVPAGTTLAPAPAPLFPAQTSSDRAGGGGGIRGGTLGGASTGVNTSILSSPTIGGATTRGSGGVSVHATFHTTVNAHGMSETEIDNMSRSLVQKLANKAGPAIDEYMRRKAS
jgi:hypothetical protein